MRHHFLLTVLLALAFSLPGRAQTKLDNAGFLAWKAAGADFICFDIRGDSVVDSIVYPCFRTFTPERQVALLGCTPRILVYCHGGIAAQASAALVAAAGYPADSVFYAGFDSIPGSRYPVADTLPLAFLGTKDTLPQNLSAHQLRALMVSKNRFKAVDIRSTGEIAATGLIKGACNIVWTEPFQSSLDRFGRDENIILNCASGYRAGLARSYMLANGFDSVRVVNFGGFSKYAGAKAGPVSMTPSENCTCSGIGSALAAGSRRQPMPDITLFPSVVAAGGLLRLTGADVTGVTWRVYDVHGSARSAVSSGTAVPVDGLRAGTYILKITGANGGAMNLAFMVL